MDFQIGNAVLYGRDDDTELFLNNGSVFIKDGRIEDIGATDEVREGHPGAEFIDAGGRILLSGFVNAHHHLYSTFAAGFSPRASGTFSGILENLWWPLDSAMDEEMVYYSALMGALDSVSHGVTTIFDHHASMNYVRGSLNVIKEALGTAGARGVLCFETSEREDAPARMYAHFNENIEFYEANRNNPNVKGMFGLHANMTLGSRVLSMISEARPTDMPVHVHCGESYEDMAFCVNLGYAGTVDRLAAFGLVTPNAILAHCVHLSARDADIIREIKPFVVTNPESNANNCVGKFNRSNLPCHLIGTDGMSGDVVSALRSYCLLGGGSREPFDRMGDIFFGGAQALARTFFPDCGRLARGAAADIAVLDYVPLGPVSSSNVLGHILHGARSGRSWLTVAGGRIVWRGGRHPGLDIDSLRAEAALAAKRLFKRLDVRLTL